MQIKHGDKEVRRLEQELKKVEATSKKDTASLKRFEDQVTSAARELEAIDYEEGLAERLEDEKRALNRNVTDQRRRVDQVREIFSCFN